MKTPMASLEFLPTETLPEARLTREALDITAKNKNNRKTRRKRGEVKTVQTPVRPHFLKPIKVAFQELPSKDLLLPADRFIPLPPVTKPAPRAEEELSCSSLEEDTCLSLYWDEVVSFQCSSSQRSVPSSPPSPMRPGAPLPVLVITDIEDEETVHVEHTGKTIASLAVSTPDLVITDIEYEDYAENMQVIPQTCSTKRPDPELKPRHQAWVEHGKVQEEDVWTTHVTEIQAYEEEEDTPADSCQKKEAEDLTISPDGPSEAKEQPKSVRKVAVVMFTWAEQQAKERVERKLREERERRERRLLHHRYMNDPKLKHLWINKHNPNYGCF